MTDLNVVYAYLIFNEARFFTSIEYLMSYLDGHHILVTFCVELDSNSLLQI